MTEINKSLIEKLEAEKFQNPDEFHYKLTYNNAIDAAIAIIRQREADMGASELTPTSALSDEVATRKDASPEAPAIQRELTRSDYAADHFREPTKMVSSDISVSKSYLWQRIYDILIEAIGADWNENTITDEIIDAIKPYLRTTEPVSVSLEHAAKAIANIYEVDNWEDFKIEAKAVLDSAKAQGVEMVYE